MLDEGVVSHKVWIFQTISGVMSCPHLALIISLFLFRSVNPILGCDTSHQVCKVSRTTSHNLCIVSIYFAESRESLWSELRRNFTLSNSDFIRSHSSSTAGSKVLWSLIFFLDERLLIGISLSL